MTEADSRERPRALLVGGTGFTGRHLAARLAARLDVTATGRACDVRDPAAVAALVAEVRPQAVANLASLTTVHEASADPAAAAAVSVEGLSNLLQALEARGFTGRLLQVSSSEVYGDPGPDALPLTESSPPAPRNPYARAKLAAEALCAAWRGRMDIVVARPFTHIGPGQSERFAAANWAHQLARIGAGLQVPCIRVGALDATRDLTDVRDVAAAYEALLGGGRAGGVYNVCSGRETAMREVLETLIALSGLTVEIVPDPERMRGSDQMRSRGDHGRLAAETGWAPRISLRQTLSDLLEDAKRRVRQAT